MLGDTILVLDRNLQVLWSWDAFDHLDPHRVAVLDETCSLPRVARVLGVLRGGIANDWLHGNSLQLTPDGNILYSIRHQDWIVKIDYRDGDGNGRRALAAWDVTAIFRSPASDANAWFSHQHDTAFLSDNRTLLVFDNGNTRIARTGPGTSRGQVFRIDEQGRTASLMLNADLK